MRGHRARDPAQGVESAPGRSQPINYDCNWTKDEPITASIERKIRARMPADAPPINVAALGVTVTLTGHVANQAVKGTLNQRARHTDGVSNVTDNLVISGGGHRFLD